MRLSEITKQNAIYTKISQIMETIASKYQENGNNTIIESNRGLSNSKNIAQGEIALSLNALISRGMGERGKYGK